MKKITLLLFVLSVINALQAQVPTAGLVGAWTFSGNANDVSGNNNNGTVFNAVLTSDRCGNANSAYNFNGSSSYIQMLTTGPTGTVSRSISFWARTFNSQSWAPVVAIDYGTATGNGDSYQIVWNYCGSGVGLDVSNQAYIYDQPCLFNGTWHHIAAVYNASASTEYTSVVYYIDGVVQPTIACNVSGLTANINTGSTFPVTIGRGATSAVRYFDGDLDDFYIYDRPLTQAEVLQLYNACSPVISGPTVVCPNSFYVFSVPGVQGVTGYNWTLPPGWTGSSNTNTIAVTPGSASGNISVSFPGTDCIKAFSSTLSVTLSAGVSVSASKTLVCAGSPVVLSVGGAMNAVWTPGNLSGPNVIVNPLATTVYTVSGISAGSCLYSNTIQVVSVACTGLEEPEAADVPSLYPNPGTGRYLLTVIQAGEAEVLNSLGQRVDHIYLKPGLNDIDIHDLPDGIYFVNVTSNSQSYQLRLIKQTSN